MRKNTLYILSNGRVAAIDKKNGEIIWEVKLKEYIGSSVAYAVGQIYQEGDKLYIGVYGILLCLNAKDGSLVWKNELKGWGYHFVSMANVNNESNAASIQATAAAASAVTSSAT